MPSPDGQEGIKAANGYTTVQCCTEYSVQRSGCDGAVHYLLHQHIGVLSGAGLYTAIVAGS
jgi:hypothetical protein